MNYYCDYGYYLSKCLFQELKIDVQSNVIAKVKFMYQIKINIQDGGER